MSQTCREIIWITRLLNDFQIPVSSVPLYCDNNAAIHLSRNPIFHERTKHIELDCHFVRQSVSSGLLTPQHILSPDQPADLFTKALCRNQLQHLINKLNISNLLHMLSLRGVLRTLFLAPIPQSTNRHLVTNPTKAPRHHRDLLRFPKSPHRISTPLSPRRPNCTRGRSVFFYSC